MSRERTSVTSCQTKSSLTIFPFLTLETRYNATIVFHSSAEH